ncbi:MAG: hypothetical protein HY296_04245 [Thaumarchaeota archaeon]|nr:hypothetical protein [Nitrososphaerota archaeon]
MPPDIQVSVRFEAAVSASEDVDKVVKAMRSVLGGTVVSTEETMRLVRMRSDELASLSIVHDQLRDRHVRGAARRLMLTAMMGDSTTIMLNRQAAAVGIVALCNSERESPLGPLLLTVSSRKIEEVIDWLAGQVSG